MFNESDQEFLTRGARLYAKRDKAEWAEQDRLKEIDARMAEAVDRLDAERKIKYMR